MEDENSDHNQKYVGPQENGIQGEKLRWGKESEEVPSCVVWIISVIYKDSSYFIPEYLMWLECVCVLHMPKNSRRKLWLPDNVGKKELACENTDTMSKQ